MKKRLFLALAAFSVLAFSTKIAAQKIEFEAELLNFETATQGDIVSKIFRFKNVGSEPLFIESAKGSCGCTRPTWPDRAIKKGETGEISVEFNTAKRAEEQTKSITVNSNDPTRPMVILRLEGRVLVPATDSAAAKNEPTAEPQRRHQITKSQSRTIGLTKIEFEKREISFGKVEAGEKVEAIFEFKNTGGDPFLLSSLRDNCNCLGLEVAEGAIVPPGGAFSFKATFDTTGQSKGEIQKTILVGGNIEGKEMALIFKGKIK